MQFSIKTAESFVFWGGFIYGLYMDLCDQFCLSSQMVGHCPSIHQSFVAKPWNVGYYTQTIQPNSIIPAMLIDSIDFYHFIPLSETIPWLGGHKIKIAKFVLFSCTLFN